MKNNFKNTMAMAAIVALLSACGGGGGSSPATPAPTGPGTGNPTPTEPTVPVVIPGDLQTTVPAMSYVPGSEQAAFVSALNAFRAQVGLGLLAQSTQLDAAATNHLNYVLANDVKYGGSVDMRAIDPVTRRNFFHIETAGKQLFSGTQELDRAKAAGYPGIYVGEEGMFGGGKGAAAALDSVTSTIYHRAGLMYQGLRDVGIAVGKDRSQTFVLEMGYGKPQTNASDFLGVYPADKQTGVGLHTGVEATNPFPELSTSNDDFPTKTGYPVSVVTQEGTRLEVITFTIVEAGSGTPLSARMLTTDNDPNRYLASNCVYLVANAPLKSNTAYKVVFSGRVNNKLVDKTWTFTTK
ncbi:CAP domain-containing protein [Massilia sp. erpn]|uniref:CAP domain-containing protein n=1 Tax=Massilia sp. erpn TaxID=2738142 RepID=UPI0021077089|nr:CAP domain-containing protein [Massilia sp. erpn]UTY55846.1 hypothetical protein HPQ68_00790 [Massilia sp. erpn]